MSLFSKELFSVLILSPLILLSACGGGGGGSSAPETIVPPKVTLPTWTAGVFTNDQELENLCLDQSNGSELTEKLWLRSWSNNTYLWYNEINDQDPAPYSVLEYFAELKTTATTPSGKSKDQFHFSMSTEEWDLLNQSGSSVGYGIHYHFQRPNSEQNISRKIIVTYTDPNSPATDENLTRGAIIIAVDDVNVAAADSEDKINIINNGLFPTESGQSTVLTIQDLGVESTRDITLTAKTIVSSPVQNVKTAVTDSGKMGYLLFNSHIATAEKGLVDAISQLKSENVNELVIDLRYNGGGLLALASQLGYMVAGNATENKIFEKLTFNEKHPNINPVTGNTLVPSPFYTKTIGFNSALLSAGQDLPTLNLSRLFVLTGAGTCSASESLMNSLRGINIEVIQIGSTTCGKPYGFYPTPNCGTTYFTVQFKGENEAGFGDYADGFIPAQSPIETNEVQGCVVSDDLSHALGDEDEALFSAAINYVNNPGTCPEVSASSFSKVPASKRLFVIEDKSVQSLIMKNRIMTLKH
jgi:C-terminal processing protease CtpA/Prc